MDRRERISDPEEALRAALVGWQTGIWTAMPGIVQSFDPVAITVVVQIAIKISQRAPDGTIKDVTMPLLLDVPVVPQRGGGCTLTFPIKKGDEALVVFANRCIDAWWQNGGVQAQIEFRMHDLSDGFAVVGPFSQKTKISEWQTDSCELRSDDHQAYVRLNPTTHQITIHTSTDIVVYAGGNITAAAQGDINIAAGGDVTVTSGGMIHLNP